MWTSTWPPAALESGLGSAGFLGSVSAGEAASLAASRPRKDELSGQSQTFASQVQRQMSMPQLATPYCLPGERIGQVLPEVRVQATQRGRPISVSPSERRGRTLNPESRIATESLTALSGATAFVKEQLREQELRPVSAVQRHSSAPARQRWDAEVEILTASGVADVAKAEVVVAGGSGSLPSRPGQPRAARVLSPGEVTTSQGAASVMPGQLQRLPFAAPQPVRLSSSPVAPSQSIRERASSPILHDVQVRCSSGSAAPASGVMRFQSQPNVREALVLGNGVASSKRWVSPRDSPEMTGRSVRQPVLLPGDLPPTSSHRAMPIGLLDAQMSVGKAALADVAEDLSFYSRVVAPTPSMVQGEQGDRGIKLKATSESVTPVPQHRSVPILRTPSRMPANCLAAPLVEATPVFPWRGVPSSVSENDDTTPTSCPTRRDLSSPKPDFLSAFSSFGGGPQAEADAQAEQDECEAAPQEVRCVRCLAGTAFIVGAYSLAGRKSIFANWINQDVHLVLPLGRHQLLACVFDGHGLNGHFVAGLVSSVFEQSAAELFLPHGMEALPVEDHAPALAELFRRAHEVLEAQEELAGLSGSTATAAIVNATTGDLTTAFVGDSRLLLLHGSEVGFQTVDHEVSAQDVARIIACGGEVREYRASNESRPESPRQCTRDTVSRIFIKGTNRPGLAMSRSLGDLEAHKIGALAEPEIQTGLKFGYEDTLVIASDGVWEKVTPEETLFVVGQDPQEAVRSLVHEAHSRWPHSGDGDIDDITAVVLRLKSVEGIDYNLALKMLEAEVRRAKEAADES